MKNFIRSFLPALMVLLQVNFCIAQTASLLPNGEQQFFDNNGNPLSSGSVYFYAPNTTTFQTTWQNANETIVNTNPITLDAAGRAIIYGSGTYRQVVYDASHNLIWDQLTAAGTGSGSGTVTNLGDGNAVGTVKLWAGIVAPAQYQFAYGQQLLRSSFPDLFNAITQTQSVTCTSGSNVLTAINDTTQIPVGAAVEVNCVPGTSIVTATTISTVTISNVATFSTASNATFFPFGDGNGSTTFNVPDLRGYVIAGRDNMGGTSAGRLTSTYFGSTADALGASGGSQSTTLTLAEMVGHSHTAIDSGHTHQFTDISNTGFQSGSGITGVQSVQTSTGSNLITTQTGFANITIGQTGGGVSQSATLDQNGGVPESTSIASGGSGYTNGARVLTVSGGTCSVQPAFNVTVAGNAVTQINSVNAAGTCTVYPANPAATTGGGGTGATLNVAFIGSGAVVATVVNGGASYTNGTQTLTVLGGTCTTQPTVTALIGSNTVEAISSVVNPGPAYTCLVAPQNPVTLSDGTHMSATANIPFNPGGTSYTNGTRIFTVEGGTCTTQPQYSGTVVNGQVTAVGSQVTASNCSIAPTNPALVQDAGGVAASATVNLGGSGYTNGSITLTVLGGTCTTQPSFNATVISGTVVAINSLSNAGSCTINPSNPASTNGGGGVGSTLNVTYTIAGEGATFDVIYGPQPFSNIQPTLTLNFVIKVLPDTSISTTNVVTSINGAGGAWTCGANIICTGNVISASSFGPATQLTIGTTIINNGTNNYVLYDNNGVLGAASTTGTPNVVVFQNSPILVTPQLGVAQATSINGLSITTTTGSFTVPNGVSIAYSGNNNVTWTTTAPTTLTLPTTGTLVNTDVTTLSSLTTVGTLVGGGTGAGFTLALGTSTLTGQVPVANGGTGLSSGTSGGVLAFTASGTIASSGALTANLPVIGGGAGAAPTVGTRSGNTTAFVTTTGSLTNGHCAQWDGSGNAIDSGGSCGGGGGSGTVNAGTTNQLAYYASNGTAVSGLTTANNGTLITSGAGVPSISSTLPTAVQGNITSVGTITSGIWTGTSIALANGGTNANLTASNGGIVYSTASALAILSGTVTANQCLLSGSSAAPSWGSCTSSLTVGTTIISGGTTGYIEYNNAGVLGEIQPTGTGLIVLATSPTITTPTFSGTVTGPAGTWTAANGLSVTGGGTGIKSGTSGGIPYFSSTTTMASSGALTANLPVIGGGAGSAPSVGSRTGNTTAFATSTGSIVSGDCASWDANSNIIDNGAACVSLSGTNTWTGVNTFSNSTQSTSTTTGAVVISGGLGVAKKIQAGGSIWPGPGLFADGSGQIYTSIGSGGTGLTIVAANAGAGSQDDFGFFAVSGATLLANPHGTANMIMGASAVTVTGSAGVQLGSPTGGDKGLGTLNAAAAYYANGTIGVSCSGTPTSSFASVNGIVTHC